MLVRSYAYCERLARREAGNFYHAFRVLPAPQRRAMCALYAYMRVTDDLADSSAAPQAKQLSLERWRTDLCRALEGQYTHPLHRAFHHTIATYAIPRQYLEAVIDGVEMDITPSSYATFAELYIYCYRVASVVGLSCIHIWGFKE